MEAADRRPNAQSLAQLLELTCSSSPSRNSSSVNPDNAASQADEREDAIWLENMRGSLMVVATVIASITYQAGLDAPGGRDRTEDPPKPVAGETVASFYETSYRHYIFFGLNSSAFVTSLATIFVLIMRQSVYRSTKMILILKLLMGVSILCLSLAYANGHPSVGDDTSNRLLIPLMLIVYVMLIDMALLPNQLKVVKGIRLKITTIMANMAEIITPGVIFWLDYAVIVLILVLFVVKNRAHFSLSVTLLLFIFVLLVLRSLKFSL